MKQGGKCVGDALEEWEEEVEGGCDKDTYFTCIILPWN